MGQPSAKSIPPGQTVDDASVELSSRRTGMSFQRTRMSAERTLMSVVRTSLSMISFGFTIYSFFGHLQEQKVLLRTHAPRNFGMTLIVAVLLLLLGLTAIADGVFHFGPFG